MANKNSGGKPGYEGRIGNSGVQTVQAPFQPGKSGGKTVVKTGTDLRSGK